MSMSLCKQSNEKDDNCSFPIVNLNAHFTRFRPLNDPSEEHEVTGRVQIISKRTVILERMDEAWGKVKDGLEGREEMPCSFTCCTHFKCQQLSSLSRPPWWGWSSPYRSPRLLTLGEISSNFFVARTDGAKKGPFRAVWLAYRSEYLDLTDDDLKWVLWWCNGMDLEQEQWTCDAVVHIAEAEMAEHLNYHIFVQH